LKLSPGLAGVHLALGRILLEARGDLDGAEREFRAEVRLHPGNAEAAWRLGSVLLKKGQTGEALAELQQSDKLKPNMLETLLELGKAYMMANQLEQAEKVYKRMIEIEDTDELAAAAHLQLSQIYRKMGDPAEAEQHLKRVRELNSHEEPEPTVSRESRYWSQSRRAVADYGRMHSFRRTRVVWLHAKHHYSVPGAAARCTNCERPRHSKEKARSLQRKGSGRVVH
jgi:tetratricopeptide (TPR) repeat protein